MTHKKRPSTEKMYDYKKEKVEFARVLTNEMGMPISESLFDIDSGLEHIKWYIDNAEQIIGEKVTYEEEKEVLKKRYII